MELTDAVNAFVDTEKPWELAKDENKRAALHAACSVSLEAFRLLTVYLKPVVPNMAAGVERFLNVEPLDWRAIDKQLSAASPVQAYQHLMTRVDAKQVDALLAANRESLQATARRPPRARRSSRSPTPSPSTTSPRWTCASRRLSNARRWKVRTSCCS